MKAWLVREKNSFYATVVFAETRGKARSRAFTVEEFIEITKRDYGGNIIEQLKDRIGGIKS